MERVLNSKGYTRGDGVSSATVKNLVVVSVTYKLSCIYVAANSAL